MVTLLYSTLHEILNESLYIPTSYSPPPVSTHPPHFLISKTLAYLKLLIL